MKMKRWSSLQREIYKMIDEHTDLQIHLSKYRMNSQYGSTDLPRYWMTLGNEIIFDYPKQFVCEDEKGNCIKNLNGDRSYYPYTNDITEISNLIREYIDTPKEDVFLKHFENDHWGLINILKAADRRFGKRRLEILKKRTKNNAARKIIEYRLNSGLWR
ncbi:MAG: hypothetical protein IJ736_11005 [Firmicutes bacterium]|nr:hypothetical protein [Bacillota bacterium]